MNSKRAVVAVGFAVACLGLGVRLGARRAPAAAPAADDRAEEIAQLQSSLQRLQREVATDRAVFGQQALRQAGAAATNAEAAAPPDQKVARAKSDRERPVEVEMISKLDEMFDKQATDAVWSRKAVPEVTRVLSGHLPSGGQIETVDCRTDLCRIQTHHASVDDYQKFLNASFMARDSGLWNGGFTSWVVDHDPKGVVVVSYLAKEGRDVPNVQLED